MGAAGETCRPLKPLRRQSGQSDVTKTSLLQPLSALVVEERDRAYDRTIRLSQSSLGAFSKVKSLFSKQRLYLGGLPRYINGCQSIILQRV